jgi:2-polyprenyl-3-methyl-5-hydroxy-6-metoxy-1,4-benzoquinol methylase
MNARTHWDHVYETRAPAQVSWYQEHAQLSLHLIQRTGVPPAARVIDAGGGASTLVDGLVAAGFQDITVLDISGASLKLACQRLGAAAAGVTWLEADITEAALPGQAYDIWHDRAVFHFLARPAERQRYADAVRHAVRRGGHVIIATFALDGPDRCSGLETVRYSPGSLHGEFGADFTLVDHAHETHHTPFGTEQAFLYCYCRKL